MRQTAPRDLGAGQRSAGQRRTARARHSGQVPREGRVHHRRPGRRPGVASGDCGFRAGDQGVSLLPPRQSAQRAPAGDVQRLGGPAGGGEQHAASPRWPISWTRCTSAHDYFHAMGGRLSDHGLNHAFGRFRHRDEAAADFRARPRRPGGHPGGARPFRRLHDVAVRPSGTRRRAGPSSCTWARGATTIPAASANWARIRVSIRIGDWPQVRCAGRLPGPAGPRERAAQDGDLQPESGRQLRDRHHDRQLPGRRQWRAKSSSAAAGGSWTRRRPCSGR